MRIEFLGHSSFLITTTAGTRIVTDPFDPAGFKYRPFEGSADAVTMSHSHADHAAVGLVKGNPSLIRGIGACEAKEVGFLGVGTFHDGAGGSQRGANTVFVISAEGLRVAHLGDLGHVLTADQVAEIGRVDVALVPVGGYYTIDAREAQEVADQLGARIVIPMHYKNAKCNFPITGVDAFTKGKTNVRIAGGSVLEVTKSSLPADPEIVVLEPSL